MSTCLTVRLLTALLTVHMWVINYMSVMASCVRNIYIKNYLNLTTGFQVTIENGGDGFGDTVYRTYALFAVSRI